MVTWTPLESNPDVLNKYLEEKLGVSSDYMIVDVLGLDPEMLAFTPQPVKSVILLFPCSKAYEEHRRQEDEQLSQNSPKVPDDLFYMKQTIHNACGTIAIVHSVLNHPEIKLADGLLKNYFEKARALSPEERGKLLEADEAFTQGHEQCAAEGQTNPNPDEPVNHHFIALIHKDGELYELDGRKNFPVKHGPTTPNTLLADAAEVCKKFMARDKDELRFNVLALAQRQD